MLENDGHWLKLMRSAPQLADANICIRISGPDISCRVIQHVTRGVELRVTCSIADQKTTEPELDCGARLVDGSAGERADRKTEESSSTRERVAPSGMLDASASPTTEEPDADGMVAVKTEDNIAKPRELNSEHQADVEKSRCFEDLSVSPPRGNPGSMSFSEKEETKEDLREIVTNSVSPVSEMSDTTCGGEQAVKSKMNGDHLYKCPLCTYWCYRERDLVSHVKVHDVSVSKERSSLRDQSSSFCEECNIQFMSAKTYQVHKEVYCKARHELAQGESCHQYIRSGIETEASTSMEDVFVVGKNSLNGIPPVIQPQGFFAAISTNPLILLPCSLVNGQGIIPQNGIISTGAPIVLPGGITGSAVIESNGISLHPREKNYVDVSTTGQRFYPSSKGKELNATKHSVSDAALDLKKPSAAEKNESAAKLELDSLQQNAPLDLTVRKRKSSLVNFATQQQTTKRRNSCVQAMTPPTSLLATSSPEPNYPHIVGRVAISPPSFSNDASSSSGLGPLLPIASLPVNGLHGLCKMPDPDSPDVLISTMETTTQTPQSTHSAGTSAKLLKHGNNRCENCNIIFYKYDNYLAHKKHYCAYRRQHLSSATESLSAMSDMSNTDDNSNQDHSTKKGIMVDETSPQTSSQLNMGYGSERGIPSSSLYTSKAHSSVYRCDACGVKFSTADNLHAHQTYYCSRKMDNTYSKYTAQRKSSKSREPPCHRCGDSTAETHDELCCPEEWKCNFCDAVCPSLKTARRHLLTHSEIRGFNCVICGYRGNTLRGMRTHVYEHLNGNTSHIEDILASSVSVDSGTTSSNCLRVLDCSDEEVNNSRDGKVAVDESSRDGGSVSMHLATRYSPSRGSQEREAFTEYSESDDGHVSPRRQVTSNGSSESNAPNPEQSIKCERKVAEDEYAESGCTRTLNPGALCDVVIKTEDEDSAEKIVPERMTPSPVASPAVVKDDPDSPEEEIDVEKTDVDKEDVKIKLGAVTSVICRVSTRTAREQLGSHSDVDSELTLTTNTAPKKRTRTHSKSELKYCKSCDISFNHLSNFIAHKKFYCVSRVIGNFQQETAPVQ